MPPQELPTSAPSQPGAVTAGGADSPGSLRALGAPALPKVECNRELAERWLGYARRPTQELEATTYYYIRAIRLDPSHTTALTEFLRVIDGVQGKVPALSKHLTEFNKEGLADQYCTALLRSGISRDLPSYVKTVEVASIAELADAAKILGERALQLIASSTASVNAKRDAYVALCTALESVKLLSLAETAIKGAFALFPRDIAIGERHRQVTAAASIQRMQLDGGVEQGAFRKNIRDPQRQAELEQGDRIVQSAATLNDKILQAREERTAEPQKSTAIVALAELLIRRGEGEDLVEAEALFVEASSLSNSPKLRQRGADVRLTRLRSSLAQAKEQLESEPENREFAAQAAARERDLQEATRTEMGQRVKEEPGVTNHLLALARAQLLLSEHHDALGTARQLLGSNGSSHLGYALMIEAFLGLKWWQEALRSAEGYARQEKGVETMKAYRRVARAALASWISGHDEIAREVGRQAVSVLLTSAASEPQDYELRSGFYD